MNKRAIVLKFIVSIILALIIFIPACLFLSQFFRLSEQADTSFNGFLEKLDNFQKSGKEKDSYLLILDQETFIAAFRYPSYAEFQVEVEKEVVGRSPVAKTVTVARYFSYPSQCTAQPCFCLCREAQEGEAAEQAEKRSISYSCKQVRCTTLQDFPLSDNWGISRLTEEEPRRIVVEMKKENNQVILAAKK